MAGYSTLKATRSHFAPLESFLDTVAGNVHYPNVTAIEDLEYTSAKRLMLNDLQVARGYDPNLASDTALIDDLSDKQTEFLQQALAYRQLWLVFTRLDNGQNSLNRERKIEYAELYMNAVRSFGSLTLTRQQGGRTARSVRITL